MLLLLRLMGLFNASLLIVLASRAFTTKLLKAFKAVPPMLKAYKWSIAHHRIIAYVLLATGFIHGYLSLGGIALHTGWVLYSAILLSAMLGTLHKRFKKPVLFKVHRLIGLLTLLAFAVHFFLRDLLS